MTGIRPYRLLLAALIAFLPRLAHAQEHGGDNGTEAKSSLPERIDTDRQRFMAERMMSQEGMSLAEARARIANTVPAKRFGKPEEFGDACAFLCSAQAGFITATAGVNSISLNWNAVDATSYTVLRSTTNFEFTEWNKIAASNLPSLLKSPLATPDTSSLP